MITNQQIHSTSITLEEAFTGKELLASITLPSGKEQTINIKIPAGIHDGTTLRLTGMGDDTIANAPRGDILLAIHIQNHADFNRSGDDLVKELEISCIEAMLGTSITVKTIDGNLLQTTVPAGVQFGTILNLAGYGMPNFNETHRRGRLLLKLKIKIPVLSDEQKTALQQLNLNQ